MKKLWELIAREFSNEYHVTVAPNKVENKFNVLERDNKTGRGRKNFEF